MDQADVIALRINESCDGEFAAADFHVHRRQDLGDPQADCVSQTGP